MSVLENIYQVIKNVVALARDIRNYQAEIKEIRHELRDLTFIVQRLDQEIHHAKEMTASEYANILLEVENKLLRFQQHLNEHGGKVEGSSKRRRTSLSKVDALKSGEKKAISDKNSPYPTPAEIRRLKS